MSNLGRPIAIESPNFKRLTETVKEYIDFIESESYHEDSADDYRNAIFESAIEAVYGRHAIWDHINTETDRERDYGSTNR